MEANTILPEPVLKLPPRSEASSGEEQREEASFFFSLFRKFLLHIKWPILLCRSVVTISKVVFCKLSPLSALLKKSCSWKISRVASDCWLGKLEDGSWGEGRKTPSEQAGPMALAQALSHQALQRETSCGPACVGT